MLAPNAFDPIDQAQDSRKAVHSSNQDIETTRYTYHLLSDAMRLPTVSTAAPLIDPLRSARSASLASRIGYSTMFVRMGILGASSMNSIPSCRVRNRDREFDCERDFERHPG